MRIGIQREGVLQEEIPGSRKAAIGGNPLPGEAPTRVQMFSRGPCP